MNKKIKEYILRWKSRGYPDDIPDEVPLVLMQLKKAPSYKAVCMAILRHDHALETLGFTPKISPYYRELKRIEIESRDGNETNL